MAQVPAAANVTNHLEAGAEPRILDAAIVLSVVVSAATGASMGVTCE
jgi:hypothetical protein